MITANNITDEQIRELLKARRDVPRIKVEPGLHTDAEYIRMCCECAIGGDSKARARCAEILNARAASKAAA